MQQLQNKANTNISILEEQPIFSKIKDKTYIAFLINTLYNLNLQLTRSYNIWSILQKINRISINLIINQYKHRQRLKKKLNIYEAG